MIAKFNIFKLGGTLMLNIFNGYYQWKVLLINEISKFVDNFL